MPNIFVRAWKKHFTNYKILNKSLQSQLEENRLQLEYLKEHVDITKLKPATGLLRMQQLELVKFATDFF